MNSLANGILENLYRTYELDDPIVPREIKDGATMYTLANQAEFTTLDVVTDVQDSSKRPLVVVYMPYWSRVVHPRTREIKAMHNTGVCVMNIDGGNQCNVFPIERYQLFKGDPQPVVPESVRRWILERV